MAEGERSFWSSGPGILLASLLILIVGVGGGSIALIHAVTHPARSTTRLDPEDFILPAEEIEFDAADGVPLAGWFVRGRPGWPAILLCHDLGSSRSALLNTAVSLSRQGYPLLLFDFRGHGASGGRGSSLGIQERLDVLGAIDALVTRDDLDAGRFGAYGIGQGAYAAALAATEREEITVLALDSVYPDVASQLDRLIHDRMPPGLQWMVAAVRPFYNPYLAFRMKRHALADSIGSLADRNVLFLAATGAPERFSEQRELYAALPDAPGGERNFLELESSGSTGLYGDDRKTYDEAIAGFFTRYLKRGAGRAIETIEVVDP